jgi:wyosine [tRNA(Phe)-imidazoG37] synthetase (radical SAM superfamily)
MLRRRRMTASTYVSGPDASRRFGRAVHVNLVGPGTACSFHCAYCRSPRPALRPDDGWPSPSAILDQLTAACEATVSINAIVIGGHGEPTRHPAFAEIMDTIVTVRDALVPGAKIAVRSNGSTLGDVQVRHALSRADVRLMKLDAGDATTFRTVSAGLISLGWLVGQLAYLGGVTLSARFVRNANRSIDNTSRAAVDAWLEAVARIAPVAVEVCGCDWEGHLALEDVPGTELAQIAARVESLGIPATVV